MVGEVRCARTESLVNSGSQVGWLVEIEELRQVVDDGQYGTADKVE
jgi:hypothetical protein